jgi:type I restriction enzyme R subunit
MKFTESQLEQAFIELLGKEEIPHLFGKAIQRSPEEVLIKKDLQEFLLSQYKSEGITLTEVESIICDLERFSSCAKSFIN